MAAEAIDLGPFARDQGRASVWASAGAILGVAAFAIAVSAAALDAVNVARFESRTVGLPLGVGALLCSLIGLFQTALTGRRGKGLAASAAALAVLGGVTSFIHGAVQDGDLKLSEFGTAYFDRDVISAIWGDLLRAARNTIKLAAISEALGIVIGLVLATFAISKKRWIRVPAIAYIDVVRGLPLVMMLILVYFGLTFVGVRLSTTVAAIAGLTINSSAYIAEIFRAGIQSIERGQMDAARSLGMPQAAAMVHVIIPQAVRRVIPPLTNEFIALVKDTALVIVLGATVMERELMTAARQSASVTFSATPYMAASLIYLAMTLPLIRVVTWLEKRITGTEALPLRIRIFRPGGTVNQ